MNKKILGVFAATLALGSAVFAAPAHATEQEVDVEITVQPAMFLRTFDSVQLNITQADLGATTTSEAVGISDGTTPISREAPSAISSGDRRQAPKSVPELFAVWGNAGNVRVDVTVPTGGQTLTRPAGGGVSTARTATMAVAGVTYLTENRTLSPDEPVVGGADLTFDFSGTNAIAAGTYTGGKLMIRAVAAP